jgi:hypothetical protein
MEGEGDVNTRRQDGRIQVVVREENHNHDDIQLLEVVQNVVSHTHEEEDTASTVAAVLDQKKERIVGPCCDGEEVVDDDLHA